MAESQDTLKAEKGHLQVFFLVALEAVLSSLLKTDPDSRQLLKLLIAQNAVIQVKTHLPAENFYITFSPNGVLLDYKKPEQAVVGKVSGSFPDLIRAFFSASPHALDRIRLEGEPVLTRQLTRLMHSFNLPNVAKSLLKSFWFGYDQDEKKDTTPPKRTRELIRKIDDQKKQIEHLTIQSHKESFQAKKQQRRLSIISFILFVYSLLITLIWGYGLILH